MQKFKVGDLAMLTDSNVETTSEGKFPTGINWAKEARITELDILIVESVSIGGSPWFEGKRFYQNAHNFTKVGEL